MLAKFRADHYLIAEFDKPDIIKEGKNILQALKEVPELKDLAIVTRKLEDRKWSEILGRIDVPAGSKAFWAMIKDDFSEREPYHLLIRFDMNAEGETIEEARAKVKGWIENDVVPHIEKATPSKNIQILQANELYMPQLK